MKRSALGKGLDKLISMDNIQTEGSSAINDIPINQINPNPDQPRQNFDEEALEELAASIRELGIIQPLTLRSMSDNTYQIISGERRYRAALLAGLEKIEDAGHTAGVYSSSAFYSECIDRQMLLDAKYPIWEANYFNTSNGLTSPVGYDLSGEATIWQYSGCGRCAGIRTTVDRNICYTDQFFNHQAVITNSVLPGGTLKAGSNFTLAGTVSSDNVLRTITGTITRRGSSEPLQTVTVYPHAKDYKLTGFFTKKMLNVRLFLALRTDPHM